LKPIGRIVANEKIRFNKRIYMFIFFLSISAILWLLQKLNHEYTDYLQYPVTITHLPENRIIAPNSNLEVNLKVNALGYHLLRYKMFSYYNPIQLPFERYRYKNGRYFIVLSALQNQIVTQLSSDLNLLGVSPDTLFFELTSVKTKFVPVILETNIVFEKQHMQAGKAVVKPDSVKITGSASVIDTITMAKTQKIELNNVSENIQQTIHISSIEGLFINPVKVDVFIPVDKFTEARIKIPITIINIPQNYEVLLSPKEVTVICNVPVKKFFKLKPEHFRVVCDFNDMIGNSMEKIRVSTERSPDFVGRIQVEPRYVDFIIIRH